jgi:hypothetical protein
MASQDSSPPTSPTRKTYSQLNQDLKFFDGAQFLKVVKESDTGDLPDYFGGKSDLLKFLTDFICTKNFQNYVQKYFNVHLNPVKSVL